MASRKTVLLPERNLVGNDSDWLKIVDVIGNSRWHLSWSLGYRRRLSMRWIVLRKPMARPKTEATQQRTLLVKSMLENIWTHIHESILGSIFDSENMLGPVKMSSMLCCIETKLAYQRHKCPPLDTRHWDAITVLPRFHEGLQNAGRQTSILLRQNSDLLELA